MLVGPGYCQTIVLLCEVGYFCHGSEFVNCVSSLCIIDRINLQVKIKTRVNMLISEYSCRCKARNDVASCANKSAGGGGSSCFLWSATCSRK